MKMYYKSTQNNWLAYGLSLLLFLAYGQARAQVFAYVPNNSSNNVSVINTTTNLVTTTITGVTGAYGVAVSSDGSKAYITGGTTSNVVYVITTATNTVTATIPVGSLPISAAINADGSRVYVSNLGSSTVSVINTATNAVVATVTVGAVPYGAVVSPDGSKVYIPNLGGNTVSVINTATNTVSATITVGSAPLGITITPDGSKVYVTNNGSGSVSVINTVTNTVTTTISIGGSPNGITITPDGTKAYVANGNNVSVINTATNTLTTTVGVGTSTVGISVTPDGSKVYVANSGSSNVSVINTTTNTVSATIAVGSTPIGLGNMIGIVYAPPTLQYRTAGAVTFASATNWESSPDGTTWSAAASAPDATANTLAITIRNGHTVTVGANITLDQLTVAVGGTLVVNDGVALSVADGTEAQDLLVNGTIDIQGTGVVDGAGTFALASGGKFITNSANGVTGGNITAVTSWVDGADYTFNATNTFQTANLPVGVTIRNLEINNTDATTPSVFFDAPPYTITGTLTLTAGSADFTGAVGDFITFSGATPIVRTGGTIATSGDTNLSFIGTGAAFTLPTGTFSNTPFDIGNFTIDRTNDLNLSNQGMQVIGTLAISSTGKLNLNGNNIILSSTGILSENLADNGVVYDATATGNTNKGGYIQVTNFPTFSDAGFGDISGTGLQIQGTGTVIAQVRRYHYPPTTGGGANISKGIKRVYSITGVAEAGVTDIRLNYASSELNGISDANDTDMYMSRWRSTDGWKSYQHNGTTVVFSTGTITMLDIDGFSDWTMSGAVAPLPITLLWLKGERVEGQQGEMTEEVRLQWATATEINNKGFEVEMSKDGLAYQTIAFVEGKGNSTTIQSYNHTTIQSNDGYYRLKQVDFDGKFSYSPIVFVEGLAGKVVVYPNPNNGSFTVSPLTSEGGITKANLFNAQGVEVPFTIEGNKISIKGASGTYFLHTIVAGKTKVTKVVIER